MENSTNPGNWAGDPQYMPRPADPRDEMIQYLMEENRGLMKLVEGMTHQADPVELIKALNPPPAAPVAAPIPWADDPAPDVPVDPWADERVTTTQLREGWGDNPGVGIPGDPYRQNEMLDRFNQNISGDQIEMEEGL